MRVDYAGHVRRLLADPRKLCEALGLLDGAKRQARGVLIRCPAHGDRTPSCSVTTGQDGTVRVRCFACQFSADALGLVAQVLGLPTHGETFRELLAECAKLGGDHALADEILGRPAGNAAPRRPSPKVEPQPEPEYPPADEVRELWESAGSVSDDVQASWLLASRRIDPDAAAQRRLLRVLDPGMHWTRLPRWARYRGASWLETGHRVIARVFDHEGRLRSVRAWRVIETDTPKRLPPAGHKSAGLVLANELAWLWLRGLACPRRLVVTEGEPDFVVASTRHSADEAVVGIGSGSWTPGFARKVPPGTEVIIRTHHDPAGKKYAQHIFDSLRGNRCPVWRSTPVSRES